jgi:hypothetical protein
MDRTDLLDTSLGTVPPFLDTSLGTVPPFLDDSAVHVAPQPATTTRDQAESLSTPAPPSTQPPRRKSRKSVQNVPATPVLFTPPPTQSPALRSPSPEIPTNSFLPPVSRVLRNAAYVSVPPRVQRPRSPNDASSDAAGSENNDRSSRDVGRVLVTPPVRKRARSPGNASSDTVGPGNNQPSHIPWILDEQHPQFLHNGQEFLLNVPGGYYWTKLLTNYVKFEKLAPPVSCPSPLSSFP